MDETTQTQLADIRSTDRDRQNAAYNALLAASEQPVAWSYDAWDDLLAGLTDPDNHVRAIAAQLLCNLAAHSDPDGRIERDFAALLAVTHDERFVTARHCLQSLWKVGLAGPTQRQLVIAGLEQRYQASWDEKNGTLVRFDILVGLRQLYDATGSPAIKPLSQVLIDQEPDPKYRQKFARAWKGA